MLAVIVRAFALVNLAIMGSIQASPHNSYSSTSYFSLPSSHQAMLTLSETQVQQGSPFQHLTSAAVAGPTSVSVSASASASPRVESHESGKPYKFEYKVHDSKSHNYHERAESSDGEVVRGFYSLLEPHGEVRVVKYRADHDGFQSEVSRHGQQKKSGDSTYGGSFGANIGSGGTKDIGSHNIGSHSFTSSLGEGSSISIPSLPSYKESIPIHEEMEEGSSQWAGIENPKYKRQQDDSKFVRSQDPSPEKERRIPEQILLQQQKKKALQQHKYHGFKPIKPYGPKFHKRPFPSSGYRRPPRHHGPFTWTPKVSHLKRIPPVHLRPRPHAHSRVGPVKLRRDIANRRVARPPATPCQCNSDSNSPYPGPGHSLRTRH